MKSAEQSWLEQKRAHPYFKPEITEQITMIVPGRRALGETWSKVTIGHDQDEITVQREDAPPPADGRSIMVVAGEDSAYAQYILTAALEKAQEHAKSVPELTDRERFEATNAAWFAFMEDKLKHLKGQTSIGSAGMFQRQRVYQNPATRPMWHK